MKRFIDVYEETVRTHLEQKAVVGEKQSLTYRELDKAASRIYGYLKKEGIGKEDFVQIILPRDVKIIVSITGVIKAGAAFMVLEDTYPRERVDYIYKDCGCVLHLDEKLYDAIMKEYEPLSGHEETDLHDAAYAVYTSGSTGNPKGVLHEYGNIDQTSLTSKTWYTSLVTRSALYPPFYFIAGIMDYISTITNAHTSYIMPHSLTRDFVGCKHFIRENQIEKIYLPPSLLRIYDKPEECLKVIMTGSEPANGLSYHDKPYLINVYGMSEAGFYVLNKSLSKPYDVAPVGRTNYDDIGLVLIDEDGKIVEGEGQGEICFINEYVRGYINLHDQTNYAFRDGIFHTNDCARRDVNGDYYIVGRYDDMIKINGNRVEPVEIENHIKNLTGLKRVVAKGFDDRDRSYIVLYYIKEEAREKGIYIEDSLDFDKEKLSDLLPEYMIPTYYVGLDEFPLTPTGKVSRRKLKAPDVNDYAREYVEPDTELEKILCDKMAEVLKRDKISAVDDFYALGGDSMKSMLFITACNEIGVNITSKALYDYRTPRELSTHYEILDTASKMDSIDEKARHKKWPLFLAQKANLAFGRKSEELNSMNIPSLYRLKKDVDIERLRKAVVKVLEAHPGMRIRIAKEEQFYQMYEESYGPDCNIIEIDKSELDNVIKKLYSPFNIFKERLYCCNIYKTEEANYFFMSIHHVISDGTSRKLLLNQIAKSYEDEKYVVPKDYYFYLLTKRFEEERWGKVLDESDRSNIIDYDYDYDGRQGANIYEAGIAPVDESRDGSFFVAALAMAIAQYNGRDRVVIKEVFNGRNELYTRDIAGELAIGVTIEVEITEDKSFEDIRDEIRMQELYESTHPPNRAVESKNGAIGIRFNYQKGTVDKTGFEELSDENLINMPREKTMNGTFSFNIIETDKKNTVDALMLYATSKYQMSSMRKVMDLFLENVRANL